MKYVHRQNILLSGDVELNPGPGAISNSSEKKLYLRMTQKLA